MKSINIMVLWILIFAFIGFHMVLNKAENYMHQLFDKIEEKAEIHNQPQYQQNGRKFLSHIMNRGETLIDLEEYYGVDWRVIKKVNQIEDERKLQFGQIILIPILLQ